MRESPSDTPEQASEPRRRGFGTRPPTPTWARAMMALVVAGVLLLIGMGTRAAVGGPAQPPPSPSSPSAVTTASSGAPPGGYLHTDGAHLVDDTGHTVLLTGVNWFGFETDAMAPGGLSTRSLDDLLDEIVAMGFNTIRLPFTNEMLRPGAHCSWIDYALNPGLRGKSPLQVMDALITGAGKRGLKVILDQHRPTTAGQSALWYTAQLSEDQWIADWRMLAARYKGNDTVIGFDLHNEPHSPATWGDGNPYTDWRQAAERAGDAILAVNPHLLIVVEGIDDYAGAAYWWGGDLQGAAAHPVALRVPHQLVYSTHDYSTSVADVPWMFVQGFPANLPALWRREWAYLAERGIAPVLVGEFGGRSVGATPEGIWQRTLVAFLKREGISYTYWTLNPDGQGTGGVLQDDWRTPNAAKLQLLRTYQAPLIGDRSPGIVHAGVTGPTPATRTATAGP